jgi:pyridoxine/pyridoxamine 5'-phosphate oxidase
MSQDLRQATLGVIMTLHRNTLVQFIRERGLGVVSTISPAGAPEAALVNLAVTDDLELVFYTLQDARKCVNLRRNRRIAIVIGWEDERTLQVEGLADEPHGGELDRLKDMYSAARPNARAQMAWPGLTWFRVRPKWVRLSNYGHPWSVEEMTF